MTSNRLRISICKKYCSYCSFGMKRRIIKQIVIAITKLIVSLEPNYKMLKLFMKVLCIMCNSSSACTNSSTVFSFRWVKNKASTQVILLAILTPMKLHNVYFSFSGIVLKKYPNQLPPQSADLVITISFIL